MTKQLAAGVQEIYVVKIFQIPGGTKKRSLSLVKLKTSPVFLKMNSTTDIYSKFSKIFRATISRWRFCLNILLEITVYWCNSFYFPIRPNLALERVFFGEIFSEAWDQNTLHCLSEKYIIPLCAQRHFVLCRLKTVTHIYMKLLVPDNLVLFLCYSGVYRVIYAHTHTHTFTQTNTHTHMYIYNKEDVINFFIEQCSIYANRAITLWC